MLSRLNRTWPNLALQRHAPPSLSLMRAVLVIFFAAICSGCLDQDCSNDLIEELPSPSGKTKIVLFSRSCGATTGFNTQGMILKSNQRVPNEAGNAFIIDKGNAKVTWTNEGAILVVFDRNARFHKQETSVRGITIEYRQKSD